MNIDLVDVEIIKESLKETQQKYLNSFVNIELYNYLIDYMEKEKESEEAEEAKAGLEISIENTRQQKLATIKMIDNHINNIKTLKSLI